jgi:hypothetical protein
MNKRAIQLAGNSDKSNPSRVLCSVFTTQPCGPAGLCVFYPILK